MSYATPEQFLARYDARVIGDVVSDTGEEVSPQELLDDPNLQAALDDATGDIDSSAIVGERYLPADLETLAANAGSNSRFHLIRICCDIALAYLLRRRPSKDPERDAAMMDLAESHLEKLRRGDQLFYLGPDQDLAGVPSTTGPTTLDFRNLNLLRDRVQNYYPARLLPYNR